MQSARPCPLHGITSRLPIQLHIQLSDTVSMEICPKKSPHLEQTSSWTQEEYLDIKMNCHHGNQCHISHTHLLACYLCSSLLPTPLCSVPSISSMRERIWRLCRERSQYRSKLKHEGDYYSPTGAVTCVRKWSLVIYLVCDVFVSKAQQRGNIK